MADVLQKRRDFEQRHAEIGQKHLRDGREAILRFLRLADESLIKEHAIAPGLCARRGDRVGAVADDAV